MKHRIIIGILCMALALGVTSCAGKQSQEIQLTDNKQVNSVDEAEPAESKQEVEPVTTEDNIENSKPEEIKNSEETIVKEEKQKEVRLEKENKPEEKPEEADPFTEVNETVYATGAVNTQEGPGTEYDKAGSLGKGDAVNRIGVGTGEVDGWSRIKQGDSSIVYVSSKYLSTTKPVSDDGSSGGGVGGKITGSSESNVNDTQDQQKPAETAKPEVKQEQTAGQTDKEKQKVDEWEAYKQRIIAEGGSVDEWGNVILPKDSGTTSASDFTFDAEEPAETAKPVEEQKPVEQSATDQQKSVSDEYRKRLEAAGGYIDEWGNVVLPEDSGRTSASDFKFDTEETDKTEQPAEEQKSVEQTDQKPQQPPAGIDASSEIYKKLIEMGGWIDEDGTVHTPAISNKDIVLD